MHFGVERQPLRKIDFVLSRYNRDDIPQQRKYHYHHDNDFGDTLIPQPLFKTCLTHDRFDGTSLMLCHYIWCRPENGGLVILVHTRLANVRASYR